MIDVDSFNRSLKAVWIKKYLDTENQGGWKSYFDFELRKYGGVVTLTGNLNKKDTCILKISDPFIKEILEIWSEVIFERTVVSEDHFLSSPLWYNSLIRIENKPVFYKYWRVKGVTKVENLMDDSGNFLSLPAFQNKYNLKVRPLTFYGLLLFNKLSLCPYMVRKPSISVILHYRYPAIYVNDHIWKCTADFLSLLVWRPF